MVLNKYPKTKIFIAYWSIGTYHVDISWLPQQEIKKPSASNLLNSSYTRWATTFWRTVSGCFLCFCSHLLQLLHRVSLLDEIEVETLSNLHYYIGWRGLQKQIW